MSALDRNNARHPPNVFVPRPEDRPRLAAIDAEVATLEKVIESHRTKRKKERDAEFDFWLAAQSGEGESDLESRTIKGSELHLPMVNPTNGTLKGHAKGQPISLKTTLQTLSGVFGHSLQVGQATGVIPSVEIGDFGNFSGKTGFSYGGYVYIEGKPNGAILARMDPTDNHRGWDLWIQGGQIGAHIIEQWPSKTVKAVTEKPLKPKQWHHVFVVFDPKKRKANLTVYIDGNPAELTYSQNKLPKNIHTAVPLRFGARAGNNSSLRGLVAIQDFWVVSRAMNAKEVRELVVKTLTDFAHLAGKGNALKAMLKKQFDLIQPPKKQAEQVRINPRGFGRRLR